MNKVAAVLKLTRAEHSLMLVIAVLAAEMIAGHLPSVPILILSMATPILISMGAFAINDYFDVEVDRANRKRRPLVTGDLSRNGALWITAVCMVVGVLASALINADAFIIALFFAAISLLYSYKLKELLLIGNSYIALSMAIPFVYGSYVVSSVMPLSLVLVAVMIFLSGLAREIHGSVRDFRGDVRMRRVTSVPRVFGLRGASAMAYLLYISAIFISVLLFIYYRPFSHNIVFGTPIFVTDIALLYVSTVFLYGRKGSYDKTRNISLGAMALALIAIFAAALLNIQIPF